MARVRKDNDQRYALKEELANISSNDPRIQDGQISNWDYTAGVVTTNAPVWNAAAVSVANSEANWDAAFSWGNHATAGYAPTANPTFTGTATAPTLRLTDQTDVSLSSTGHAFQIGPTSGVNLAIDGNELAARNNGAGSELYLNHDGGAVYINGAPVTSTTISNWNTAYGWGNHASAGYADYAGGPFYHYLSKSTVAVGTTSPTLRFGRSSDQYMTFHGYSGGNVLTSVSSAGNPKSAMYFGVSQDGGLTSSATWTLGGASGTIWHSGNLTSTRITNWDTAFGWGNHASAGYLTGNQTISLTGDVSGSGTTSIAVTVNDDSHAHSQVSIPDTRGAARAPNYYPYRNTSFDFQHRTDTGAGSNDDWHVLQTVVPWASYNNEHRHQQLAWAGSDGLKFRYATSDTTWAGWQTLLTSSNYGSYAPTLTGSGASGTWGISITGNAASATWADQVDVNANQTSQNGWYDVVWHSGDHVFSSPYVQIYPSLNALQASRFYINNAYLDAPAGNYGSMNITGAVGSSGTYSGYAINDRVVFMNNNSTTSGLYNDVNNEWFIRMVENAEVSLYHNAGERLKTTTYGVSGVWSNNGTANISSQIRKLTQAQYNAISTKDANTLYIIVG